MFISFLTSLKNIIYLINIYRWLAYISKNIFFSRFKFIFSNLEVVFMESSAILFLVVFWGAIVGAVGITLTSLMKHQKAENN